MFTLLFRRMEVPASPLGDKIITPVGKLHPLGSNFTPGVQSSLLGSRFKTGLSDFREIFYIEPVSSKPTLSSVSSNS
jgi:hypothetical protein